MKFVSFAISCLITVCTVTQDISAQEALSTRKSEIVWAQEFLRAIYPGLVGKNYTLTVETYLSFDRLGDKLNWLRMDVGEGPKDFYMGHSGGCASSFTASPLGWPQELGTPPPPVFSSSPQDERCKEGPIYPKQFLSAGFQFDKNGQLISFGADGSDINDRKADTAIYETVKAHPQMSYAQVVATMKQHGTKYGPDDKEQFIKDLPLKQLEPFLGELQIVSVSVSEMTKDPNPVPWTKRWLWPDWTVKIQATTVQGKKVPYELHFNHLGGYLTGLLDCRISPWCSHE